jgi:N-methylhydantoinase A
MVEVDCRLDADGNVIRPLTDDALDQVARAIRDLAPEAVAINLLFSFIDPEHETRIESVLKDEYFVSRSSAILPEYREFERGLTTWVNAWIGPLLHRYLIELKSRLSPCHLSIMQSSGLTIAADQAATRAVNLLLSGPAGGLSAAMFIGKPLGADQLMTFDMGGTSTDVALLDGEIKLTNQGRVADFPIAIPMADIHTIGAGGGSIAYIDEGGLLQVGPESAGADPGPACYGKGGTRPTVTDANLILGRLQPDAFLGGRMTLDRKAAERVMAPLADKLGIDIIELAFGIVRIANEHMTQALRVISIQRGFDPRDFTLTCFGGAGGLHFCDLAESLEMTSAIVPINSGVFSALGMLSTAPGRELVITHRGPLDAFTTNDLEQLFSKLEQRGVEELEVESSVRPVSQRSLDVRYSGQTYTLNVPFNQVTTCIDEFHRAHERRYGHRLPKPVELVNLRVHLEAAQPQPRLPPAGDDGVAEETFAELAGFDAPVRVLRRENLPGGEELEGPALIVERHATTLVNAGWRARIDEVGNLVLERPIRTLPAT